MCFLYLNTNSYHLNYSDIYYWWGQKSFCPDKGGHESLIRTSPDQTHGLTLQIDHCDKMTSIFLWIIA